jgi:hypothetical protein
MPRRVLPLAFLASVTLAAAPFSTTLSADVIRESTGQRRADLDKMELAPFPAEAWGKLTAWANGDALTPASTADKPILIVSWSSWHPASVKGLSLAQRMADKFGPQGLIVLGVHGAQGWDDAAKIAGDRAVKFPLAHDSSGDFRRLLKIDHDPEYYVVDRAGHLRYAAVAAPSVEEACGNVANETAEQAANVPGAQKKQADEEAQKGRRMVDLGSIDLAKMPPVPPGYDQPAEDAYKSADWPRMDEDTARDFGMLDQNNKQTSPKLAFEAKGWYPTKPETRGRALVIYFWHPDVLASYSKAIDQMDRLQQQHARDLAVVGALVPANKVDKSQRFNDPQHQETPDQMLARFKQFIGSRQFRHALAADPTGSSLNSIVGQFGGASKNPGVIIVSSDGIIRWAGQPGTSSFTYAVDTVLANDPGVQKRREADHAFIRAAAK